MLDATSQVEKCTQSVFNKGGQQRNNKRTISQSSLKLPTTTKQ